MKKTRIHNSETMTTKRTPGPSVTGPSEPAFAPRIDSALSACTVATRRLTSDPGFSAYEVPTRLLTGDVAVSPECGAAYSVDTERLVAKGSALAAWRRECLRKLANKRLFGLDQKRRAQRAEEEAATVLAEMYRGRV